MDSSALIRLVIIFICVIIWLKLSLELLRTPWIGSRVAGLIILFTPMIAGAIIYLG